MKVRSRALGSCGSNRRRDERQCKNRRAKTKNRDGPGTKIDGDFKSPCGRYRRPFAHPFSELRAAIDPDRVAGDPPRVVKVRKAITSPISAGWARRLRACMPSANFSAVLKPVS